MRETKTSMGHLRGENTWLSHCAAVVGGERVGVEGRGERHGKQGNFKQEFSMAR